MARVCGSCIYFDGNNSWNYCRRDSPTPELSGSKAVVWPQVDPVNDWCAEGYNDADGSYNAKPLLPMVQQPMDVTGKKV